jgi:hypothetical protein
MLEVTTVSVVARSLVIALSLLHLIAGARTGVEVARGVERFDSFTMLLSVLTLAERALVDVETEPREGVDDDLNPLFTVAIGIGVFNAKEEHPVVLTGEQPVEQR